MLNIINRRKITKVVANPNKIKRDELSPSKIELLLQDDMGRVEISTILTFKEESKYGTSRQIFTEIDLPLGIKEQEAYKLFEKYSEKLEKGEYTFYVSCDGRSRIEWN